MGVENQGRPSSRSEDDVQLDSGWDEEPSAPVESRAEAPSNRTSAAGAPQSPMVVIGNRGSVPPSVPRPDPAASRADDAPASGRPSRPSASYRAGRLSKPLIDVTAHTSRLIDLPISDAATLVGSPSAPIAPTPHDPFAAEPPSARGATAQPHKPLDSEVSLLDLRESSDSAVESLSPSHADRTPASAPARRRALRAGAGIVALLAVAVVAVGVTRGPRAEQPLAAGSKRAPAPLERKVHALTPAPSPGSEATSEPAAKAAAAEPAAMAAPAEPTPKKVLLESELPPAPAPSSGGESSAPAQPSEQTAAAVRVTIRTSPPGAVIFDERRRIGKDTAVVSLLPGQKRRVLALLNRHQPTHIIVDGSVETVNIELKPMAPDELERAAESDRARSANAPALETAAPRSTGDR